MKRLLPVIVLVVCLNGQANQGRRISNGLYTGKDFLDMSATQKEAYASGAINGMLVAPLFDAPETHVAWLEKCTAKMTDEQIAAIIAKYVRDQPAQWHYPLNVLTFNAMRTACPKSQFP